MVPLMMLY